MATKQSWDVVVIGSGFGGAVTAARLAERGMRVLVLERGPWWGPGGEDRRPAERRPYPRGPLGIRKVLRGVRWARGRWSRDIVVQRDGLLEVHVFPHLLAVTSSGVGGGSHVYTNIQAQPDDEYFDAFPAEITAAEMKPHNEAVRAMLRPAPAPERPPRTDAFGRAVGDAGLEGAEYPDLAMVFAAAADAPSPVVNAAGVMQRASTYSGTEILGCEDRSKTTLDLTDLQVALRHGAEIRPLAEVTAIGRGAAGYAVHWRDHVRRADDVLETPRLVLAAGTLGTTPSWRVRGRASISVSVISTPVGYQGTPSRSSAVRRSRSSRPDDPERAARRVGGGARRIAFECDGLSETTLR